MLKRGDDAAERAGSREGIRDHGQPETAIRLGLAHQRDGGHVSAQRIGDMQRHRSSVDLVERLVRPEPRASAADKDETLGAR